MGKQDNADNEDDDIFGWEPPSALMQLQSMVCEVDREELEKNGSLQTKRKGGIVISAAVERSNMAALKKQAAKLDQELPPSLEADFAKAAVKEAAAAAQTDVDELD